MILKRNKSCLIIYGIFLALFKVYIFPSFINQGIKAIVILGCLYYIFLYKKKMIFNISLVYGGIVSLNSLLAYINGYINLVSLINSFVFSLTFYSIYTVIGLLCTAGEGKCVIQGIFDMSVIYSFLTLISLLLPLGTDDSGLVVYLFGNKFASLSYLLLFFITFSFLNKTEIFKKRNIKLLYYILFSILGLLFCFIADCSTGIVAFGLAIIGIFIPKKVFVIMRKPLVSTASLIGSSLFPFFMPYIMENSLVKFIIVDILHESVDLNFRNIIYHSHIPYLLKDRLLTGYGYNNTAMLEKTGGVFANAQNGLLEIMLRFGLMGAIFFVVTVVYCVGKSKRDDICDGYVYLIFIFILMATIEVVYSWVFILLFIVLRWYNNSFYTPKYN